MGGAGPRCERGQPRVTERVVHVVGARPNFMKAGPVVGALGRRGVEQLVIHTGQHYDRQMSEVFFSELGLPQPDVNLGVGSGSQAVQTAALLTALEPALLELDPALVLVYGDINSTLATSIVASKLDLPTGHVEAGLRSFDMTMPEEVNRRVTDILSDLCFVTSPEAIDNLRREGVPAERIHFVGNPMIDTLLANLDRFDEAAARREYGLDGPYAVATLHRPANVDTPDAAARLVAMIGSVTAQLPVVLPLHPRGRATLAAAGLAASPTLRLIEPLGYIAFLSLVRGAAVVVTDSGGIQEETTILGVPCLTVRPNTERPITISHGTNRLVEPDEVGPSIARILAGPPGAAHDPPPLWDGHAGDRIADVVVGWLAAHSTAA
jgi:UDP-N-acetylglucosamine 2-epimerase (non-hydrolysing)